MASSVLRDIQQPRMMAYDPVITSFNSARLANTPIPILRHLMDAVEVRVVHSLLLTLMVTLGHFVDIPNIRAPRLYCRGATGPLACRAPCGPFEQRSRARTQVRSSVSW